MPTEAESNLYKQSATYKHFEVVHNLRALVSWAVNEKAYKIVTKAIRDLETLDNWDFGEDSDGKIHRELLPLSKPDWKE